MNHSKAGKAHSLQFRLWGHDVYALRRLIRENRPAVEAANRDALQKASALIAVLLLLLLCASLFAPWRYLTPIYGSFAGISILIYCFTRFLSPRMPASFSIHALFYFYIVCQFALSFCLAFFIIPRGTTTTFMALLISLPLIVLDLPIYPALLYCAIDAVFIICCRRLLPADIAMDNIVNCLILSFCGLFLGRYVCEIKVQMMDARRHLSALSYTDSLTGLGNRRKLFETLAQLEQPGSAQKLHGVMMLDIDLFKQYNDRYGHQMGDDCLRQLGALMQRFGAQSSMEFFRYGGEEFLAITAAEGYDFLNKAAEDLLWAVWDLNIPFENSAGGRVTLSIGFAEAPGFGGYERCISDADHALYAAKKRGRNMTVGFRDCSASEKEDFLRPAESLRSRK